MNKPVLNYPKGYKEISCIRDQYYKNKYILVSFKKCANKRDERKIKDYLCGMTYAFNAKYGNGYYYEHKDIHCLWASIDIKSMYQMLAKIPKYSGLCAQMKDCL